ncbi:hypothetical protein [Rhizobium sp. BR 362]|uniref:hypothetical protein n=1 Tax=Rhizobium sp. BR 362 TaxID=3040670 RepID=UPI002F3EBDD7
MELTDNFRNLTSHSFRSAGSVADIIELAVAGHLQKIIHLDGVFRIDQLLFDLDEVKEQLMKQNKTGSTDNREFDHEMIKLDAARRRLGVGRATIEGLVENGLIEASLRVNDRHHKGRINKWIRTADLDEFAERHCTVAQIVAWSSIEQNEILGRLADQNVDPVFEGFRQREKFFRRSDIEELNLI